MKTNALKMLAMKAKNRMMNKGNGDSYSQARFKVIDNNEDQEFIERVRQLLDNEKKSMNPMKYLMDDKAFMKLDANNRERYMLEITEKYLRAKAIIEKEKLA